ncbi:MAG: hypothetical protein U5K43_10975 [Halofilum sp. (in: g-proteobacteria)]|nr:hypothetical protein [Halofilum sp. (in: g-proteobacteria)]
MRANEDAVTAAGKSVLRFRVEAFVIGSMFMGLGGALYAHFTGFISPGRVRPDVRDLRRLGDACSPAAAATTAGPCSAPSMIWGGVDDEPVDDRSAGRCGPAARPVGDPGIGPADLPDRPAAGDHPADAPAGHPARAAAARDRPQRQGIRKASRVRAPRRSRAGRRGRLRARKRPPRAPRRARRAPRRGAPGAARRTSPAAPPPSAATPAPWSPARPSCGRARRRRPPHRRSAA